MIAESLEPEARFLFALAARPGGSVSTALPDRSARWVSLLQIAAEETALPVLREHCASQRPSCLPEGVGLQLAVMSLDVARRMNALHRRLQETLVRLNEIGITPLLLKGTALALTTYGGWTQRPMHDIDLLVGEDELDDARAAAIRAGWIADGRYPGDPTYQGHHHLAPLLDGEGSGLRLDIHRSLLPLGNPFRLRQEDVNAEAQRVTVGAGHAFVMSARHNATHIAIHFVWSHQLRAGGWKAFRDLGMLVETGQLEWAELARTAIAARAGSCAYWALRLGRSLSGLAVPDEILEPLRPRLPSRILDALEHHFTRSLLRTRSSCPSLMLERLLWTAAIQPRRHSHRRVRPWLVSPELSERMRLSEPTSSRDKLLVHVSRSSAYLAGLFSIILQ